MLLNKHINKQLINKFKKNYVYLTKTIPCAQCGRQDIQWALSPLILQNIKLTLDDIISTSWKIFKNYFYATKKTHVLNPDLAINDYKQLCENKSVTPGFLKTNYRKVTILAPIILNLMHIAHISASQSRNLGYLSDFVNS